MTFWRFILCKKTRFQCLPFIKQRIRSANEFTELAINSRIRFDSILSFQFLPIKINNKIKIHRNSWETEKCTTAAPQTRSLDSEWEQKRTKSKAYLCPHRSTDRFKLIECEQEKNPIAVLYLNYLYSVAYRDKSTRQNCLASVRRHTSRDKNKTNARDTISYFCKCVSTFVIETRTHKCDRCDAHRCDESRKRQNAKVHHREQRSKNHWKNSSFFSFCFTFHLSIFRLVFFFCFCFSLFSTLSKAWKTTEKSKR